MNNLMSSGRYAFGRLTLDRTQVFFESALSYATVNLKPLVPGHVLVLPKRSAARFNSLYADEVADLWLSAQKISKKLEPHFQAEGFTFAIQDGPVAGQTVPHVHVHILPRKEGDFQPKDAIYEALQSNQGNPMSGESDDNRPARSVQEMKDEADLFRAWFVD